MSGDGRNIAATWIEMTTPVAPRAWPWLRMWIGVIVITAAITIWVRTIAVAARRASVGDPASGSSAGCAASAASGSSRGAARAHARAVSSGSGRKRITTTSAASA